MHLNIFGSSRPLYAAQLIAMLATRSSANDTQRCGNWVGLPSYTDGWDKASVGERKASRDRAFTTIEDRTRANIKTVLEKSLIRGRSPRNAATKLAIFGVEEAETYGRF